VAKDSFEVWNSDTGALLNYNISTNQTWLSCSPVSGTSTGEHDVIGIIYNTSGLLEGYYNATITITATGATNTPQTITVNLSLGNVLRGTGPAGGLIFYDKGSYSNGWRYLEAAPNDQSTGIVWWNNIGPTGATATAIGTGQANTTTIVTIQGVGSYAAQLCDTLALGGFSDWFLPSQDELNQMYINLKVAGVGSFADDVYWSSTENSVGFARSQNFSNGDQNSGPNGKSFALRVRAVRAF
jgi:hypothetical protein